MEDSYMNIKLIITFIIILFFSLISSIVFLLWFFKKKKPLKRERINVNSQDAKKPGNKLEIWRFFVFFWPLACITLAGIIIYQSAHEMEKRLIGDAAFTIIPLIFFAIGMAMRHRLLKERRYATVLTTAVVTSVGRTIYSQERHFFPEYEFHAGGKTYNVKSTSGYNVCFLKEGREVDLYYAPENPKVFYVPAIQKHDNRMSMILCITGVLFPLAGFFAPNIRTLCYLLRIY